MYLSDRKLQTTKDIVRSLLIRLGIICIVIAASLAAAGQSPSPSPDASPEPEAMYGGYYLTAALEGGWRWRSLNGNENKYRSDLNYKEGFRTFDSSILLQSPTGKGKYFDSLLFTNSGWGSDPQGSTRFNLEKTGAYKFTSNVRRVNYFNNLYNFANPIPLPDSEHNQDTKHTFGDFDFTMLPQSRVLRVNFGVSFNDIGGSGGTTERFFGDEFAVKSKLNSNSIDFRVGAEGTLWGFDWALSQGFRKFEDRSFNYIDGQNEGNNPTNQSRLDSFNRSYPTDGNSKFTQFSLHRLFAERLDFTGRLIYSTAESNSSMLLLMTGRDNTNPAGIIVNNDKIDVLANAKRPQTRGDLGLTYAVTNKLRISNTFSFDQFAINSGETFSELWTKLSGAERSKITNSSAYRRNAYKRYSNLFEGDYQFNNNWSFHAGYRYTHRQVHNIGNDVSCATSTGTSSCPNLAPPTITFIDEEESNNTHAFIAGMKIKPTHNWSIYWDVEHGQADNVFIRVGNYDYTNFRVRSHFTVQKFTFNLSAVSNNNENPSEPSPAIILPPNLDYITTAKNRFYSGSVDWEPDTRFMLSSGYTYRHLTTYTPVVLPFSVNGSNTYVYGNSQYFMRDNYFFFDISAKPIRRVSFYGSYRISLDHGQGDRISSPITATNPNFLTSYPMQLTSPEVKVAIRINRNIDWNLGYQYYGYHDTQTPFLNYNAHLPYTSLRFYFGGRAADR